MKKHPTAYLNCNVFADDSGNTQIGRIFSVSIIPKHYVMTENDLQQITLENEELRDVSIKTIMV